ncbi:hypothetical protein MKX03_033552 [Papaver bracteatum]|nr:hypothetical protein MKX03_033552 [Papaver bracteatum]
MISVGKRKEMITCHNGCKRRKDSSSVDESVSLNTRNSTPELRLVLPSGIFTTTRLDFSPLQNTSKFELHNWYLEPKLFFKTITISYIEYSYILVIFFPYSTVSTSLSDVGTTGSALDDEGVLEIDTTISLETTWHAMEDLVSKGLVRIAQIVLRWGIQNNYDVFLTRDCTAYSKVKPAVNQIETHPYFQRESRVKFCQKHGICALAEKYKKTVAQIVLRWGIQRNTIVIPKSSKLERLEENFKVFDFELTKVEDMESIKNEF